MPGLVPGIHAFSTTFTHKDVDGTGNSRLRELPKN
jgi:hypothetical protein